MASLGQGEPSKKKLTFSANFPRGKAKPLSAKKMLVFVVGESNLDNLDKNFHLYMKKKLTLLLLFLISPGGGGLWP